MVKYTSFTLENGLRVIVHPDPDVQIAVLNILYDVGSRDESPNHTGFAHLFEHLMFGGSKHIPDFDGELQKVGGENNAFTSPDITNYYMTMPAQSIETGFWLESDRMLSLNFDPEVLEVQRKVVIEEFKQRYLNQPYGDVWLKLRPMAYSNHPYQWATIGKEIEHIEEATMDQVQDFFFRHYRPDQAILVVAGKVTHDQIETLANKWFGDIPKGEGYERDLPIESIQSDYRREEVHAQVPASALYMAFHMPARTDDTYYAHDLLSDVLGRSKSSRLHQTLVREQKLFTQIGAYVTGSLDPGLLVISGQLSPGVTPEEAENAVFAQLELLVNEGISTRELEKVKNQAEASIVFGEVELLQRAMNLAFHALNGDPEEINRESEKVQNTTLEDVMAAAHQCLRRNNCSALHYHRKDEN